MASTLLNQKTMNLARRWRPQTFTDLIGQAHIVTILTKAIELERLAHGYLFTGTRGIGKTSTARILAKAIRCQKGKELGLPVGTPCNECVDCIEISQGRSMDVLEIDGASHNGVDSIRGLRDGAQYLPSTGKYRIYIIDEVHMLSTAAFNALLKTLEEPPPHLIFIFATTDPQKIPATILSRCQRFDFRRVSVKDLTQRLSFICEKENIQIEPTALTVIVREADGSLRDAMSLLDQVITSAPEGKVSFAYVQDVLGTIDKSVVLACLRAILTHQPQTALASGHGLYQRGLDLREFLQSLTESLRNLFLYQSLKERGQDPSAFLEVADSELQDLASLYGIRPSLDLDFLFLTLLKGLDDVTKHQMTKVVTDVLLVKLATLPSLQNDNQEARPLPLTSRPVAPTPAPMAHAPANARPFSPTTHIAPAALGNPPSSLAPSAKAPPKSENLAQFSSPHFWAQTVKAVKNLKPLCGVLLENATFQKAELQEGTSGPSVVLHLGFSKAQSFYREQIQTPGHAEPLLQALSQTLKLPTRIQCQEISATKSIDEMEKEKAQSELKIKQEKVLQSEAMRAIQEVLGGRLDRLEIK